MDGIHLLGEWYDCPADTPEFTRAEALRKVCLDAVLAAELTAVGEFFFQFEPHGVTGTVVLAESHLAIHTWPESGFVTIDVYVCNYTNDNTEKAQKLYDVIEAVFKPGRTHFQRIVRGGWDSAPGTPATPFSAEDTIAEMMMPDWGYFIRSPKRYESFHSGLQNVEVYDTESFGRIFRLDGHSMTSEKDEFYYHENLVHTSAITHDDPKRVLIIGGGDGGSAEELLKHPGIENITMVEIDGAVIDIARRYFEKVHRGSFDDPRLTLKIEDGFAYIKNSTQMYDLIVLDLTDPGGPSTPLYTSEFYRACAARLGENGIMTMHVGSPLIHQVQIHDITMRLREAFKNVVPYLTSIPLYGGQWVMALCSQQASPHRLSAEAVDTRLQERGINDLQYYNGAMHGASLALPNFIRAMLPQ
jgi:spermidine synthase